MRSLGLMPFLATESSEFGEEGFEIFVILGWVAFGCVAIIVAGCVWHWWNFMRNGEDSTDGG